MVVAEQTHLPQTLKDTLLAWVKRGGKLLLTGSHVVRDYDYGDILGVTAEGEPRDETVFVPAEDGSGQHQR